MIASDRVLGCGLCAKPAALVGDLIPSDPERQKEILCFWCLATMRPGVAHAWWSETDRERYKARKARELWPEEDHSL
jgi:hypothetical protein